PREHRAPVDAVGELSRRNGEHQRRQELEESHHPQVPRARGEVVHLPAERDQQHLVRRVAGEARPEEELEAAGKAGQSRGVETNSGRASARFEWATSAGSLTAGTSATL